ncbi:MAG: hypothetical protein IPL67_18460 [Ignavibacteria bacterium]|nr:hypothetical protein [Ignavibacteria bacterium]
MKDPYKCREKSIELNNLKVENGKLENGKWKVESGKWKVENGKWKMENGKWKMENSTSPLRAVAMFFVILSKRSVAKDPYK